MQRATLGKCGYEAARLFSSHNLVKIIEITAVNQYNLTVAQSFGSQGYYNKSLVMILGLPGVLFGEK